MIYSVSTAGKTNAQKMVADIIADKRRLEPVLRGIEDERPRIRFGCAKSLLLLSEKQPELLCGKVDRIVGLLDTENRILKWNAIAILGNLAAVDREGRIRRLTGKLYGFLSCGELITANHAMMALGKIGRAFPDDRERIAMKLVGVEHESFDTEECRNIAIGKAILAIEMFLDAGNRGKAVLEFARRQTGNTRPATAKKARAFIRKCES
jgi:hypothetical protein